MRPSAFPLEIVARLLVAGMVLALAVGPVARAEGHGDPAPEPRARAEAEARAEDAESDAVGEASNEDAWGVYARGGWSTLHRGPANRKLVQGVALPERFRTWTALEGASVLTAPVTSPDGRTLYVTTGRARGHANLHAFSLEGEQLWHAEPWRGPKVGVDPCAVLSSAIVDEAGDLYLGDCNQLFAYHADGRLAWSADLPPIREGDWPVAEGLPVNALTTAVFTRDGDVFGVTNFGDVVVFDRATGRSLAPPWRLPGHVPGRSQVLPRPASLFGDGLIDPEIVEWAWQLLVGGAMPSANTPAVDLESGRVFVAATSKTPGRGALYGLDLIRRGEGDAATVGITIAFATGMGPGSGSSPALSPSGDRVYVSDENGVFYGIDARSGAILWSVQTKAASAAVAVGADGTIYALQAFGPALIAIAEDGRVRWESNLESLAAAALPEGFWLGGPVAIGNGNPTVVDDRVLVPVVYGYETRVLGRRVPWPVRSSLVAIDAETGRGVANVVALPDDSTGITVVLPDGSVINSLGTAMTSGLAPLAGLAEWLLPEGLSPLRPVGGLQVARPAGGH
jgi:outer membrane protein assembly factor BamB